MKGPPLRELAFAGVMVALAAAGSAQTDPLPSWNDGPAKQAFVKFVADVTATGGAGFVPPAERIATFDNDGTLWSEQPIYFQLAYGLDQVKAQAPKHPEWKTQEPFKSLLAGDVKAALAGGHKALGEILAVSHAGMTTDEFAKSVGEWAATARHPRSGHLYTEMVYQPMLERSPICARAASRRSSSRGGVEFMRAWVERPMASRPSRSWAAAGVKFEMRPTGPVLVKEPKIEFVDDGPGKPVGINHFIGRRPILAFGNSDGDQQMLEWTAAGSGRRFMGIVHHTDADREWAYDRTSPIGKLDKAWDEAVAKGWTVVDMKKDWKRIYPFTQ
jgi:hypothetical protein